MCLFGGYDPGYPRSAVILEGLRRLGVDVVDCTVSSRRKVVRRYHALSRRFASLDRGFDVMYVPEFRHKDMPLASALARTRGVPVVFDPLVSRFDTRVRDRRDTGERGPQAWHNRNLDRLAMGLADVVIADTAQHAAYFARELAPPDTHVRVVPVGYDDTRFQALEARLDPAQNRILFYGSYLPLHGVDVIARAAVLLAGQDHFTFELIGGGQTQAGVRSILREARTRNVELVARVPESELPGRIAAAHVCLGIFGDTDKAGRVVPNKLFQCMAMGRPVVTADTPAVREFFRDGVDVVLVPAADPAALAGAVRDLCADPARAARIGAAARARVEAEFSPVPIAQRFLAACEEAIAR